MAQQPDLRLLIVNTGSSSLKAGVYHVQSGSPVLQLSAKAERIGQANGHLKITDANGQSLLDQAMRLDDQPAALQQLLDWLKEQPDLGSFEAIGHRLVHGGPHYLNPQRVTQALIADLHQLIPLDPAHLPPALSAIQTLSERYPSLPQIACFDTAFHQHMPTVARQFALPRQLWDDGVRRYGFHGLSYEYIVQHLGDQAGARLIIAHLGNGASMAAVQDGVGQDTTMGFTPTGGLVMGTRSGDLDPGVLLYLLQGKGLQPAELDEMLNKKAGMFGLSQISGDMSELLASSDLKAAEAVALFCYQARKFLGGLMAGLGGLDTLVFTGGIGENAAPVRRQICDGLEFLGIHLDDERNAAHAPIISADDSPVTVRVVKTDEDLMIARHTAQLLAGKE